MKKQMTLFFLLLSVVTCNVNAVPKKLKNPFTKNLRDQLDDATNQLEALKKERESGKDCSENLTSCGEALQKCKKNSTELENQIEKLDDQIARLTYELEGDGTEENPGLRTLVYGNNEHSGFQVKLDQANARADQANAKYVQLNNEVDGSRGLRSQAGRVSELLKNLAEQKELTKKYSAKSKTFDRLAPYAGGVVLAGGSKAVLSRMKGSSQFLGLLHSATEDSLWLQVVSSGAALHDDSHTFLNGYSTVNVDTSGLMRVSLKNVGAEVIAASGLRLLWGKLSKSSNGLVTTVKRLPESVQYVAHEALVRTLALSFHGENPFEKMKSSKNS